MKNITIAISLLTTMSAIPALAAIDNGRLNNVEAVADRAHVRINDIKHDIEDINEDLNEGGRRIRELEQSNRSNASNQQQTHRNSRDIATLADKVTKDRNADLKAADKDKQDTNNSIDTNRKTTNANAGHIASNQGRINKNRVGINENSQNIEALQFEVQDIRKEINALDGRIDQVEGKMSNGISMVGAMSQIQFSGGSGIGVGISGYNGSNAVAISAGQSFGKENQWNARLSIGHANNNKSSNSSDTMVAAGMSYSW